MTLKTVRSPIQAWQYYLIFITSICALLFVLIYATKSLEYRIHFYGADSLYLSALFRDQTSGYSISGWKLTPAPYYFPDMIVFFIIAILTHNLHLSIWINAVTQCLLFIFSIAILCKALNFNRNLTALAILVFNGLLLASLGMVELTPILISGFHFGTVISLCLALTLLINLLCSATQRKTSRVLSVSSLGALCFLSAPSDLLFVSQFVVPFIFTLLIAWAIKRTTAKKALTLLVVLVTTASAGVLVEGSLPRYRALEEYVMPSATRLSRAVSDIFLVWPQLAQAHPLFAFALVSSFIFCVILAFIAMIRPTLPSKPLAYISLFLVIQTLADFALMLFVPVVHPRYFLPEFTLMIVLAPSLGIALLSQRWRRWEQGSAWVLIAGSFCIFISSAPQLSSIRDIKQLADYYPGFVECVDQGALSRGAHRGLAQYWQARQISMLSRVNLDVVAVGSNLSIYHWVNNINWYDHNDFDFVMIDPAMPDFMRFTREDVTSRFGPPSDEFDCGGTRVLTYTDPQKNAAFRAQFKNNSAFIRLKNVGESIVYPANMLNSQIGILSGYNRTANDKTSSGFLTYGPYAHLLPGDYQFELAYSATEQSSGWDVSVSSPAGPIILQKGALSPALDGRITGLFTLSQESFVEIRAFYGGIGELSVQSVALKRLR